MLSISTVHAETFPRYLDTVHSLSRSASFRATSLFPFATNSSQQGLCSTSGGYLQRHTTVQLTQSATTYDNNTSCSFELRLSFQISPSIAPATQSDTSTSPSTAPTTKSDTWTSPSTAPTTKSHTWTSPSTAPATKSDTWPSPSTAPATKSNTWPSPSIAPTTKSDTWPSPSTAPAAQNDSQAWSSSHMKRHFQHRIALAGNTETNSLFCCRLVQWTTTCM